MINDSDHIVAIEERLKSYEFKDRLITLGKSWLKKAKDLNEANPRSCFYDGDKIKIYQQCASELLDIIAGDDKDEP